MGVAPKLGVRVFPQDLVTTAMPLVSPSDSCQGIASPTNSGSTVGGATSKSQ
jgi:hypothetical protein